ncbi:hypothetical protein DY000_02020965 [Brassica cretica]|uniref:Uncharacterized protein n=1 Tax=Brassica cretica TaxID=69181 RepID=A0ABQ7E5I0_BRACR|nr:hypothetical protein DY000_02020965 [Brassica cretica]
MPSSTRSNKKTQLLFSPDPASLERSILKEARSSSIDNSAFSSLDFGQPPSTQTHVPSTDTRSLPSTKDTHLPSTDIFHPTSIDTSVRTSFDTEPRDMIATLILLRDERGYLHDREGHLRNAAVVKEEKLQEADFEVMKLLLQVIVYNLWCERNARIFQGTSMSPPAFFRVIDQANV